MNFEFPCYLEPLFNIRRYQLKEHLPHKIVCLFFTAVGYLERCGCLKQINLTFKGCFYLRSYWYANNYLTCIHKYIFSFVCFCWTFWIYENVEFKQRRKSIRFSIHNLCNYYFKDILLHICMCVYAHIFYVCFKILFKNHMITRLESMFKSSCWIIQNEKRNNWT